MGVGLVVMLGYFSEKRILVSSREVFLRWAMILAAIALIVGVLNLMQVHMKRISTGEKGANYSAVLLISLVATLVVAGWFGPTSYLSLWIFNYIQVPVEASLMAILAVVLVSAGARIFSRRLNLFGLVFISTALVMILGTITLPGFSIPGMDWLRNGIAQIPAAAGARGILLGVALGTIATGLRVLMGADRPYGG